MRVAIKRLAHASGLPLPQYATSGAAGMDLIAAIDAVHEHVTGDLVDGIMAPENLAVKQLTFVTVHKRDV